ncbi:hypothetical protein WA026_005318 [Henosepilachna vigintioctopunctata]|uniref:Uncharacterized protein n=1 Tax=Henosepilachna vigintioctopunctata TaxID=420089 RepID=A0AAW1UXR8_9CUCU
MLDKKNWNKNNGSSKRKMKEYARKEMPYRICEKEKNESLSWIKNKSRDTQKKEYLYKNCEQPGIRDRTEGNESESEKLEITQLIKIKLILNVTLDLQEFMIQVQMFR